MPEEDSDADALLKAYPNVSHAVSFVELFLCAAVDGESVWDILMRAGCQPAEVVSQCQASAEDSEVMSGEMQEVVNQEMRRPEFARYIAGKMGAM